ncbi:unnamed protein product [Blepharisma stoltei]|uniref:Ornithine decarboxylase antizyme n=1 Tax=Blepharisma stoltei TaxID=1481888 RepID=A0AAU9IRN3_9CILI|nr:unnamed protein product [Blepharisma stoltei]
MSISDQSTDRSSDCVELVTARCLTYSFILGRDESLIPEMASPDSEMEISKHHFMDHFPEARDHGVTFFSIVPTLSGGEELRPIFCFQTAEAVYVKAATIMPRSTFDQIMDLAARSEVKRIYIAVHKELQTFAKTVKMLMYMGFRQLELQEQKTLCHTSAVLFALKV